MFFRGSCVCRQTVLHGRGYTPHPFALSVFEDRVSVSLISALEILQFDQ